MSPPSPGWRIMGGANYKSSRRPAVNPRKAMQEWLALADAISDLGGEIAVLDPPAAPALLSGLVYTANAGWLMTPGRFRVANLSVPHRREEQAYLLKTLPSLLGVAAEPSAAIWEGQADMCTLDSSAVLLSYGVRSVSASVSEVQAALENQVQTQPVRLREPYFHGDTCMDPIDTPSGRLWMVYPGAFSSEAEYRGARAFAEFRAAVLEISETDALGYACNSLSFGESLLAPQGLSEDLTSRLQAK